MTLRASAVRRGLVPRESAGRHICGFLAKLALAVADHMGAAKTIAENGDCRPMPESRGGDEPPVAMDARLKQFQEPVVRPVHVVGEHLAGVAFGDEHVSAHRLGEETEAEHGGVIRRCYKAVVTRRRR